MNNKNSKRSHDGDWEYPHLHPHSVASFPNLSCQSPKIIGLEPRLHCITFLLLYYFFHVNNSFLIIGKTHSCSFYRQQIKHSRFHPLFWTFCEFLESVLWYVQRYMPLQSAGRAFYDHFCCDIIFVIKVTGVWPAYQTPCM